jgi:hypothetical protein
MNSLELDSRFITKRSEGQQLSRDEKEGEHQKQRKEQDRATQGNS